MNTKFYLVHNQEVYCDYFLLSQKLFLLEFLNSLSNFLHYLKKNNDAIRN